MIVIAIFDKGLKVQQEELKNYYILIKAFQEVSFSIAGLSNELILSGFSQPIKCYLGFLCKPNSSFTMTVYKETCKSHYIR